MKRFKKLIFQQKSDIICIFAKKAVPLRAIYYE